MQRKTSPAVLILWIAIGLVATFSVLHPGAVPAVHAAPLAMAMPSLDIVPPVPMMMAVAGEQDCSHNNMNFGDDVRTFRAEEHQTIAAPASLAIDAAKNGPLTVRGADRNDIAVTLCKAVGADNEQQANALLSQIKLVADGGHIAVSGPQEDHWGAALIVEVPRSQALSASAVNGPVKMTSLAGNVTVSTHNGPLSLDEISGTLRAEAHNGPVQLKRGSGNVDINAANGPVQIELTGAGWNGHLNASTENGPLQVRLPKGFSSGVEVEAGNGPFSCQLDSCGQLGRSLPGERQHITIGNQPVVVHLRADHGPIQIAAAKASE